MHAVGEYTNASGGNGIFPGLKVTNIFTVSAEDLVTARSFATYDVQ